MRIGFADKLIRWERGGRLVHIINPAPFPRAVFADTLVVDVTEFNGKNWFDQAGNFHSEALRLEELHAGLARRHPLRGQAATVDGGVPRNLRWRAVINKP